MEKDKFAAGDREARIAARRHRVEQRNVLKNDNPNNKNDPSSQERKMSKGQQQIADSLNHLDRRKLTGIEQVTNVRVETDNAENVRRINEENTRRLRLQKLQEEAVKSGKRNAAVEMRWSELMDYNMPQELFDHIQSQREACEKIMKSKDDLIQECKNQQKLKDEEYVKTLKSQSDDIELLIERMSQQFKEMQEEYELEIEQIEDAFLKERDELLASNKSDIDSLFEKRRAMEMAYMDAKQARDERYQKEIEQLRTKDAEDYNKLKIKLETDIQTLEQQLEEMRATYQLNTEKLEYNYRVLTERDMENSATLSQQKRKLSRLKDALSALKQKYTQTDARDRHHNQELTEEYRRITKQYKDLQGKFRHFEVSDNQKYQDVRQMHVDETLECAEKVLKADQVIHTQQLGLKWIPPVVPLSTTMSNDMDNLLPKVEEEDERGPSISAHKLKVMLELLASEAGFLINPKVKAALKELNESDAQVVKAESILRALGVTKESEVETLMSLFFQEDTSDDPERPSTASSDTTDIAGLGLKVTPDQVISVVSTFVTELEQVREKESEARNGIDASAAQLFRNAESKRNRLRQQEAEYWNRAANVLPEKTKRVWTALEKGLIKYNQVLENRSKTVHEVASLKEQNEHLKTLLRQYLGSETNDSLLIPPSQMIRVENQSKQ